MPSQTGPDTTVASRRPRSPRGQGDSLRTDIVAAAGRLLSRTGSVADLSLRSVAREAGVATTSLYRHFDRLGTLVLAVRLQYLDEFSSALATTAAGAASPRERLHAVARAYLDWGLANPGPYAVLFSNLDLPDELVPEMVAAGVTALEPIRAINAAVLPDAADADLVTLHFWTALHGMVTLRTVRYSFPWPDLDAELDDLVVRLVGPE